MPRRHAMPTHACGLSTALGVLIGLAACNHSEPFASAPYGTGTPFDPTPPIQLTFNALSDRGAAWLPDGSGILYSAQQEGRPDHDVCLAELPATGGRQVRLDCDLSGLGIDSTNAIESPAPSADGRLAFLEVSGDTGVVFPGSSGIAVAPTLDPLSAARRQVVPYSIPGQPPHQFVSQLRWIDSTHLIYLAASRNYRSLQRDTIFSNLAAMVIDVTGSGMPSLVPQTDFASGVSPGPSPDEIFYTLGGDTRVFRRVLSTGEVSVVHDFGPGAIARDVQVVGDRMAVVVGGRVAFVTDPNFGPTQYDSGGVVHVVELTGGSDQALDDLAHLYKRPVLSPSGDQVVAEGFPVIITIFEDFADTTVGRSGDLFLLGAP